MQKNTFVKSHGLGNEYIVLDEANVTFEINNISISKLCNVNYGIGSDGILLKVNSKLADVGLRIFNPDGSEAEKSGNGLRIFCKYIYDYKIIEQTQFTVETLGGIVHAEIKELQKGKAKVILVEMGFAIFETSRIPCLLTCSVVDDYPLSIDTREFIINCISVGNPHCVILTDQLNIDEIKTYGSAIENHPIFPNRINVQFAKIINRSEVEILIWERGAGFTLASGSSSCAVAAVLRKKGLVDNLVKVKMLGGQLEIEVLDDYQIKMIGEVRQICEGTLSEEFIEDLFV